MDIRLGHCYWVRLSKREAVVRVEDHSPGGGWVVRVLSHGRKAIVTDERRFICSCNAQGVREVATVPNRRSRAVPHAREPVEAPTEPSGVLDAAAIVLRGEMAMTTREIVAEILERKLWTTTGATPWATLNAALNRDIAAKGRKSRFRKTTRGKYSLR